MMDLDTILDLEKGKKALTQAWQIQKNKNQISDNTRLKIEILNNIIYSEVLSESPQLEFGKEMLSFMNIELNRLRLEQPATFKGIEVSIKDTEIMFEAKVAFVENDSEKLINCIR